MNVTCVKKSCYHQTVYSLEHDINERLKQGKIEENQKEARRMKV